MKPLVYIESSVISYLAARPSRDVVIAGRQAITHDWWNNQRNRFDLCISSLVEEEISRGDQEAAQCRKSFVAEMPRLEISDQSVVLAERLISERVIPAGSENDALHIGVAAAQGADFLITWNFRHINNAEMKSAIARIIDLYGFVCPQICSPEELGGGSDD